MGLVGARLRTHKCWDGVGHLLGIALAFTPCVLPMLPIVSGIVVGSQAPPRRAFALLLAIAVTLVHGMSRSAAGPAMTNPPNLIVTPCMHTKDEA